MKAVVFAYHNMGVIGIKQLIQAGYGIPLVFTYEDAQGENIWFESVAGFCRQRSIAFVTPQTPNTPPWLTEIQEIKPDIIFSFYYRSMLAKEILAIPRAGAFNLHGSFLPAYRGRCPVNWAIIKGEQYTGVTLHEMTEKPDAGDIVAQQKVEIAFEDTALTLYRKLEQAAGAMLADILPQIKRGQYPKKPQDLGRGSYCGGRRPEDGRIAWQKPAMEIYNLIRGVTRPYPGAFCYLAGEKLLVWRALPHTEGSLAPGRIQVADSRVLIGTGKGTLETLEVEFSGGILQAELMLRFFQEHEGESLQ